MDIRSLFDRHYAGLVRFLFSRLGDRDQAEDLAQEVFIRLLERPPREPHGWLYIVAANLARDAVRREARRANHLQLLSADRAEGATPGPEGALLREEDARRVRSALDALSERDRTLLLLRTDSLSYREIASVIGVSPTSIGPLLVRAQRRFVRALERGPAGEKLVHEGGGERHVGDA